MEAAHKGLTKFVDLLLQHEADPNIVTSEVNYAIHSPKPGYIIR